MRATTSVLSGPSNSSEEGICVQRYPASSPLQRRTGGVVTPLLAIRTPLSPPENHIDQYRYASIRSRDTLSAAARHPLRAFHVKPWEHQGPFVSGLFTSRTLLEHERGVAVPLLGVSQRKQEQRVHGADIGNTSTPRTRSDRWFHVKPRSYSRDAPFSPGIRPHLPVPALRLQHAGARC